MSKWAQNLNCEIPVAADPWVVISASFDRWSFDHWSCGCKYCFATASLMDQELSAHASARLILFFIVPFTRRLEVVLICHLICNGWKPVIRQGYSQNDRFGFHLLAFELFGDYWSCFSMFVLFVMFIYLVYLSTVMLVCCLSILINFLSDPF